MMYWNEGVGGWWGYVLMVLTMLLFLAVVITALVIMIRSFSPKGRAEGPLSSESERLLAVRFARGEIDEADYARRVDVLRGARA